VVQAEAVWLALAVSDLRGGIDVLLAQVVRGFSDGAQPHHACVFANHRADQLKFLSHDGVGAMLAWHRTFPRHRAIAALFNCIAAIPLLR
jgi:transposase